MMVNKGDRYETTTVTDAEVEEYDRNARRLADNRLNVDHEQVDEYAGADDQVARATYADPKARHIALTEGSEILDEKRALAGDVSSNVDGVTVAEQADAADQGPAKVKASKHAAKRKTSKD